MTDNSQNKNYCKLVNKVIQKLEFLSHVDEQIVDAHNQGNPQAEISLRIIKAIPQRHANLMKDFLIAEASTS